MKIKEFLIIYILVIVMLVIIVAHSILIYYTVIANNRQLNTLQNDVSYIKTLLDNADVYEEAQNSN